MADVVETISWIIITFGAGFMLTLWLGTMFWRRRLEKEQRRIWKARQDQHVGVTRPPDLPVGFGYKIAWLATQGRDPEGVGASLFPNSIDKIRMSWGEGIKRVYEYNTHRVYITPSVDGWTFFGWLADMAFRSIPGAALPRADVGTIR